MNEYEKCPTYNEGKAFGEQGVIVCGIERGNCQYNNEGNRLICKDKKIRTICITKGRIKKNQLEESITPKNPP